MLTEEGRAEPIMLPSTSPLPANVSELIVVRHGETAWNAAGILQGQSVSNLNQVGRDQAHEVAQRLATEQYKFAAVYSSDLRRASETAEIIASKCQCQQVTLIAALRERHLGKLEGLPRKKARHLEPDAYRAFCSSQMDELIPGGGESLDHLCQRTKVALEKIAEKHYGQQVVVVTHGGVLRALYRHAKGTFPAGLVLNTSLNVFRISDGNEWSLCSWGDVTHLQGVVSANPGADQDSSA